MSQGVRCLADLSLSLADSSSELAELALGRTTGLFGRSERVESSHEEFRRQPVCLALALPGPADPGARIRSIIGASKVAAMISNSPPPQFGQCSRANPKRGLATWPNPAAPA